MKKQFSEKFIYKTAIAAIILLFCVFEYFLHSKGFYSISADDSTHSLHAYSWYKHQTPFLSVWLPFQRVLNGTALLLYNDILITPRITSFLFGLSTLIFIIILSSALFKDRITPLLAGLIASVSLPIVVFSAVPLMEIYFFFFVVSSFTFYFLWKEKERKFYFWLLIITAAIGNTTRYESWLFSFFILLVIIYDYRKNINKEIIRILLAGLIIFSFPIFWISFSFISTGHLTGFISSVSGRYNPGTFIAEIRNNVLYNFFSINFVSLNIVGLITFFALRKENTNVKIFNFIFAGSLLVFSIIMFVMKAMPTHNHWRMAMIWSLLFIPFAAYWLKYLLDSNTSSKINRIGFIVFLIMIIYANITQSLSYSTVSYITKDDIAAGEYINNVIKKESSTKIYVIRSDADKWKYTNILVTSREPDSFVESPVFNKNISLDDILKNEAVVNKFHEANAGYLLVPSGLKYSQDPENLYRIKNFDEWILFKVDLSK